MIMRDYVKKALDQFHKGDLHECTWKELSEVVALAKRLKSMDEVKATP